MIFQPIIVRADLKAHPDRLFLFGDNELRRGMGGQAAEMRGEPNAVGVATKRAPSMVPSAMWADWDFYRCAAIIDSDLKPAFLHAAAGGVIVCPKDGIGTGRAGLPTKAPCIWTYLRARLIDLHKASSR